MSERTMHAPAAGEDVRERVATIVREAMEDAGRSERLNTFVQNSMWDYTDRILALLRAPRGEGEGDALGMLQASVDEYLWEAQNNPQFDAEAAFAALSREIRAALLRASAAPMDDEAAMIAQLRAGADAVADGSLDPDDFANLWVQRLSSLLRTPRGEGETMDAGEMWFHWSSGHESAALLGLRTASDDEAHRFLSMLADWQRCPMPSDHDVAAALRSEAQGEDDLASLIVRMWTRCRNDGPHYRESDEFWAHFERAYQLAATARRGEGGGE